MRYQGGKSKVAKPISEVIMNTAVRERERERVFVSLFCGSCAVETKIIGFKKTILNDKHKYLVALYKSLQRGYGLLDDISEQEYRYVKEHQEEDIVLGGFVGFGRVLVNRLNSSVKV